MRRWRLPLAGALALSLGLTPIAPVIGPAAAAPPTLPPGIAKASAGSAVTQVGDGGELAIGLGIGIIGGLIASEAYRSGAAGYDYYDDGYDDPRDLCADRFRSFEWDTGRYTTYAGERRLCPYLR